jgi:tRNA nucleotidyltransferase (CCA-adding enzyme)
LYLKKVLNDELCNQIRLFKKFLKTVELYGAEIKVEGFSGYLCELLIIHYGSFLNLIKEAIKWREYKTVIGGEWKLQPAPLVVVDPVDKNRNVAAAFKKMALFKFACNLFLNKPSLKFFQGRKYSEDINLALKIFEERNTKVFVIEGKYPNIPPDVFWGEIKRARQSFISFLKENEINVLDSKIYSDEKEKFAILLEVDKTELSFKKKLKGPLINDLKNVKRFIDVHKEDELLIEDSRIYAYVNRKIRNIFEAFQRWLKVYSIPKDLINVLNESKTYLLNNNVDKEIARIAVDLALKDLWWLRDELIEKLNVKLVE